MRLLFALALTLSSTVHAEDRARHVHDHARLTVTVEGHELRVELAAPAINVFSFEHAPRDAAERAGMAHDLAALRIAGSWLQPSADAGCALQSTHADSPLRQLEAGSQTGGDHAYVLAGWAYHCGAPERLRELGVDFHDALPGLTSISVDYLAPLARGVREFDSPAGIVPLQP